MNDEERRAFDLLRGSLLELLDAYAISRGILFGDGVVHIDPLVKHAEEALDAYGKL
jgi:hypothetical protein